MQDSRLGLVNSFPLTTNLLRLGLACGLGFFLAACGWDGQHAEEAVPFDPDKLPGHPGGAFPTPNEYSWDGSWSPAKSDFPLDGLLDDIYFDGHPIEDGLPTPILPPGEWDWDGQPNLAVWHGFAKDVGTFEMLKDSVGHHYGWRLLGVPDGAVDYSGVAAAFEGSTGPDIVDLGPSSSIASIGTGNLADGPDVLVAARSWSLDFRIGSSLTGSAHDNDLAVLGCEAHPDGAFNIATTTVHTGPGADWVFVRDIERAAIDLGNGDGGKTTVVDRADGHDLVVLHGNTYDFRVFGGNGNDVFVWYVDDNVQTSSWLGPSFFGGGGDDAAVWADPGTDRLVLAIPTSTQLADPTAPTPLGGLLVKPTSGEHIEDGPTQGDPYARYCGECGGGPDNQKTVIIEYNSADGRVKTGYVFLNAVEELQIGVGEDALVYRIDSATGTVRLDETLVPFKPPATPRCSEISSMIRP